MLQLHVQEVPCRAKVLWRVVFSLALNLYSTLRRPSFKFEDLMATRSETCMIGLEMENPATSQGMIKVLQRLQPLLPVVDPDTGSSQFTYLGCDQNFYERGVHATGDNLFTVSSLISRPGDVVTVR